MVSIKGIFFLLCAVITVSHTVHGQQVELSRFDAYANSNFVQLDWTIGAGSFCDGTTIFRSEDDVLYHEIGMIDGICGSADEPVGYTFADTTPMLNQKVYYKIRLGYSQFSLPVSVIFRDKTVQYSAHPNPSSDQINLWFNNANRENYELIIYTTNGNIIYKENKNSDTHIFNKADIGSGQYYFVVVFKSGKKISGRLTLL